MPKKSPITRTWYLFVPKREVFEEFALEVEPTRISAAPQFVWYLAVLPDIAFLPEHRYIVAEGGTGYILGRGATPEAARKDAKDNATARMNLSCYIRWQVEILRRFFTHQSGFVLPKPEIVQ